ncbi:MAG: shikimate dehydrogenase [Burkholderiaceae bacterium]
MDRYVVAGNPVEHSQSPFIHTEFARQTGQTLEYGRVLWPLDGFADSVQALAASGAKGCNITLPFKFDAFRAAHRVTPRAALAQAANVLRFDADDWLADNTDGVGLVNDIERNAGVSIAGKRVLLIGAGGAAAGVLGSLLAAHPNEIVVANRTPARAQALVDRHLPVAGDTAMGATTPAGCGTGFDIVVNASASSLHGAGVPVSHTALAPGALALDMMYGPLAQPFLDWATANSSPSRDGLGMLVEQAAAAFELWRGVRPDTASVLSALRERMRRKAPSA